MGLADLPDLAITEILRQLARSGSASYAAFAMTCKRFCTLSKSPEIDIHIDYKYYTVPSSIGLGPDQIRSWKTYIMDTQSELPIPSPPDSSYPIECAIVHLVIQSDSILRARRLSNRPSKLESKPLTPKKMNQIRMYIRYRSAKRVVVDQNGMFSTDMLNHLITIDWLHATQIDWICGKLCTRHANKLVRYAPQLKVLSGVVHGDAWGLTSPTLEELTLYMNSGSHPFHTIHEDPWFEDLVRGCPSLRKLVLFGIGDGCAIKHGTWKFLTESKQLQEFKMTNVNIY
jgi:hypothetical protein